MYTDVPDWRLQDWAYVALEARAQPGMQRFARLSFNLTEPARAGIMQAWGISSPLIADGTVQTYLFSPDPRHGEFDGTWRQLLLQFCAPEPSTIDLLSVKVIPKEATFALARVGVSMDALEGQYRRTLYTHAPSRLTYQVRIPDAGQLDVGLRAVRRDAPVTFRVTATPSGGEPQTRLEETVAETEQWGQRRVDLSDLAGQTVSLALEADADRASTVALWGVPTVSGVRTTNRPNVIFYVIDGAGADWMSLYGYNRRTTPFLEELAREGALFEHAYSNATWTKPSTPSFMTSLYYSVLGGLRSSTDRIPEGVTTMAEHFGRAGYQTAVFTSNPHAVTTSGLERGVDTVHVINVPIQATSSEHLHREFWRWREAFPGQPYWTHFQTTDVHEPFRPQAPFAGLFVTPELRAAYIQWERELREVGGWRDRAAYEKVGISIEQHALAQQGLYDEGMAHQDHQLGQLVARLKAAGEWENTLLIIASDHGYPAGSHRHMEPMQQGAPYLHPFATRIPLIFIWPNHIPAGQRFTEAVSMIDVLPTVLDLVGLPLPEVMQGQSLAPLLVQRGNWEPRPVIIDMFALEFDTGQLIGSIEVIDGRWGASLSINPVSPGEAPPNRARHGDALDSHYTRTEPLLVYDLWSDPYLQHPVNGERPDLVEKYTKFLEEQWKAHHLLAQQFTRSEDSPLTAEQLRTLRALGYIR